MAKVNKPPVSERSAAIRTAGVTGASEVNATAAGLEHRFLQRERGTPIRHMGPVPEPAKASTVSCPRCSATMTMAKLGDESDVEYCTRCRLAIPAKALH
jgi:ribosomal protein S27AE